MAETVALAEAAGEKVVKHDFRLVAICENTPYLHVFTYTGYVCSHSSNIPSFGILHVNCLHFQC